MGAIADPLAHFAAMIDNCLAYAEQAHAAGRPIVGIMCEYTPRELILAAGGVPVCLCGGDADMIGPAEEHLPANLCPLIKSTYGYHLTGENPFLEMASMLVAETTCDGKKKMYELLAGRREMYVLELPQKQDDADGLAYWTRELRKFQRRLEDRFGVRITRARLRDAIRLMNRERGYRRRLARVMRKDHPPLTGRQLLDMKSIISCMPADFEQYRRAIRMYARMDGPPQAGRGEKGQGGGKGEKGEKVRVLLTGVPVVHGAEKVMDIIEAHGGLVVCQENCTGLRPILDDVDADAPDPIRALAEKYYHLPCSVMTPNARRMDSLRRLAREYRAQCIVELIWQACLTYDVESYCTRRLAEEELHLPYLRIETDYSPSDSSRIAVRAEALFETVRASPR